MRARVTKEFPGVVDGEVHPRQVPVGEVISGELARVALDQKWAVEVADDAAGGSVVRHIDDMKVVDLRALAAEKGVDVSTGKTKAEIVEILKAAGVE